MSTATTLVIFRPTNPEHEIAALACQLAQPVGKLHPLHAAAWARLPQFVRDNVHSLQPANPKLLQLTAVEAFEASAPQSDAAVAALVSVLGDRVLAPRALAALRKIGPYAKDSVPKILEIASQSGSEYGSALESVGVDALRALGTIAPNDERVISLMIAKARLGDYQSWTAFSVMAECAPFYNESARVKLLALADEDPNLRHSALRITVRIMPENASTAAHLLELLRDPDPGRKLVSVELLSERPTRDLRGETLTELQGLLVAFENGLIEEPARRPRTITWISPRRSFGSEGLEALSLRALGQIGPPAASAVPALQRRLSNRSFGMRFEAARAIFRITGDFDPVRKVIDEGLGDSRPQIRSAAANQLCQLAPESHETVPLLCRALSDSDKHLRLAAARTLGELGSQAALALPHLDLHVSDPSPGVREQVTNAIAKIRAPQPP